jgi:hypothetical protein
VSVIRDALGRQSVDIQTMLVHYLVAVPIAAILLGLVQLATKPAPAQDESADSQSANEAPLVAE